MEQKELRELEEKCTQESPPACTATCPIHVDARSLLAQVKKQDMKAALEVLRKKQPFPGIISRICDHPCEQNCKRREAGDAISISALEKYCVENVTLPLPKQIIPPGKSQRIAIVGSGLSGMTATLDLAKKGYQIVLLEAEARLGGSLWGFSELELPRSVLDEEFAQLQRLGVEIRLNTPLGSKIPLTELSREFQAVYLAVGTNPAGNYLANSGLEVNAAGQLVIDPVTFSTSLEGVFAGGSLRRRASGYSPINSAADGRRAAISIDRFLQQASLTAQRENEGSFVTKLHTNTQGFDPLPVTPMTDVVGYSQEEAAAEAERCLQCQCLECVKGCRYLESYGSYPKKYLREIYNNESIVMGKRQANKMINSCSLCGQCAEICPNQLDMGAVCLETRASMVSRGKMPPSAHDFALQDLAFNNSDQFTLTRHQPDRAQSKYMFFPGCQLSGSNPEQVALVYQYLREKLGVAPEGGSKESSGVGLMLRCCGAPAEWAGRPELFQAGLQEITAQWESMGKPSLILACSTCYQMFKAELPQVEIISLWEVIDQAGLPNVGPTDLKLSASKSACLGKVAIHDACTTRQESQIHTAVRNILQKLGYQSEELPFNREQTQCCGYGGLMSFANPALAKQVTQDRIQQSSTDYVAYCAM